jgi:hypothetical protein
MGAIEMISKECKDFYKFLDEDMLLEAPQKTYLVKKFDRMLYKNYILSVLYERQTMGHT